MLRLKKQAIYSNQNPTWILTLTILSALPKEKELSFKKRFA